MVYQSAIITIHKDCVTIIVQGIRFDPDLPQTLRLEFAKTNTKVAKPKQQVQQLAIAGQLAAAASAQNAVAATYLQAVAPRTYQQKPRF